MVMGGAQFEIDAASSESLPDSTRAVCSGQPVTRLSDASPFRPESVCRWAGCNRSRPAFPRLYPVNPVQLILT